MQILEYVYCALALFWPPYVSLCPGKTDHCVLDDKTTRSQAKKKLYQFERFLSNTGQFIKNQCKLINSVVN